MPMRINTEIMVLETLVCRYMLAMEHTNNKGNIYIRHN